MKTIVENLLFKAMPLVIKEKSLKGKTFNDMSYILFVFIIKTATAKCTPSFEQGSMFEFVFAIFGILPFQFL